MHEEEDVRRSPEIQNGNHESRWRGARRDDATTGRRTGLDRVMSPLTMEQESIVSRIMDCGFTIHRALGPGFKEAIYQRAMYLEMDSAGLRFESEKPIEVHYRNWRIPGQRVDLLVEDCVLVEVKAVPRLRKIHESQAFSYLKTLDLRVALLMNFNARVFKEGFRRVVR